MHKDKYLFLQSILQDSDLIDGTYKFKSGFREACAVLNQCDYVIGGEGGFTHAAGALNKRVYSFMVAGSIPKSLVIQSQNIYIDIEGSCGMKLL